MTFSAELFTSNVRRSRKSIGAQSDARHAADKENATVDVGSAMAASRKSRSKSMGPGGLDALKQSTGNRRASLAAPVKLPRSILKPTISLLPEIPPLKKGARGSSSTSSVRDSTRDLSLSSEDLKGSKLPLRTEEEQQAAAREREERDRRDARRKSLANRRVSFAAEATLHTFHEIEYMQDSTTSTDSTRRASSAPKSPSRSSTSDEREENPQSQVDIVPKSPDNQRELHQRRRRSSGASSMNFGSADDDTIASTVYSSDSEPADAVEDIVEEEDDASTSDSDDGTMMTIDTEEVTGVSVASDRSTATDDDSTLDEALRIAARRAGNQDLREERDDEDSDDGEEIIPSFGWVKKVNQSNLPDDKSATQEVAEQKVEKQIQDNLDDETDIGMDMDMDMDMTSAVGRIIKPLDNDATELHDDVSMDVTKAIGGILSQDKANESARVSPDLDADDGEMEFTTAIGGIRSSHNDEADDVKENEDMSMELTSIMGGVLSLNRDKRTTASEQEPSRNEAEASPDDGAMDMTVAVGRIISADDPTSPSVEDMTMGMDMTTVLGGILNNRATSPRTLNKRIMEEEADRPNSPKAAIAKAVAQQSPLRRSSRTSQMDAAPSDSPGQSAFQGKGLRRSSGLRVQATPESTTPSRSRTTSRTPSPLKGSTPRQRALSAKKSQWERQSPKAEVESSPLMSSPVRDVARTPSPKKSTQKRGSLFRNDMQTGSRTPTVILTPSKRELSGVGLDRAGLGSPKVAALCDRRESIGNSASNFVPGKRIVAFEEPKDIERELDRERHDDEDKENGRKILEREADGSQEDKDATFNLREMINSLSPKWKPLRGRKSLHVGSAKGLLGKRPAELDDEEAEFNDGVKRLKGHQSSPVKNIRLQQPPSVIETTGRLTRSARKSLEKPASTSTPSISSPVKDRPATTPQHQGRFKDVDDSPAPLEARLDDARPKDASDLEREVDEEKIHLQDFLNMTSIRFMELTTTKRRHTVAPGTLEDGTASDGQDTLSLERCVVAGACTVPMLELYQHSCRELKKYISEGRRMVKEIENETFEENPPLFREYMSATPDVKALMDNQFKNVKTHARLLSKAMWYEWRMKLQDGLKEGLISIAEGMDRDDKNLEEQQEILAGVLPAVSARYTSLQEQHDNLQEVAQELADCDPAELQSARDELVALDEDVAVKRKEIAELRQQLEASTTEVEELSQKKAECLEEIEQSEKTREKFRGWTSKEVNTLKARVDAIEKKHGWTIAGFSGSSVSFTYKREIELLLDTSSLQSSSSDPTIELRYIADSRDDNPSPKTMEKEFFLQVIRDDARIMQQSGAKTWDLLGAIQSGWDEARRVSLQISRINVVFPTNVTKSSDSTISVTSSLLLVPLTTRVEVTLMLRGSSGDGGVVVGISAGARVIYGEHFNIGKIQDFLMTRIGNATDEGGEDWSDILMELQRRLIARGKKQEA
ncbi:hypothetical protein HIM_03051 [Hirsutella minnesotensis 3608]|nr:hypothetical protein HIM_03051 [Hirsutella minnesotensis 3608]